MYGNSSSLRGCAKRRNSSTSDIGEEHSDAGPKRRLGQLGMELPQGRFFQLPGQGQQLIGKLELALRAQLAETLGLQLADDGIDKFHGHNVGFPSGVDKTGLTRRHETEAGRTHSCPGWAVGLLPLRRASFASRYCSASDGFNRDVQPVEDQAV